MPGRLSGDDKEQKTAENEGNAGRALRPAADRAEIAARRHHALVTHLAGLRKKANCALPSSRMPAF
jgi:hypothetical protein